MRPTQYHCTIFKPEQHYKKTCAYEQSIHFCQENIEWSGNGVEQKSGISHLFNLSKFEFLGFQILVIQDLQGINFHTVVFLALIFHLQFKLLSALCGWQCDFSVWVTSFFCFGQKCIWPLGKLFRYHVVMRRSQLPPTMPRPKWVVYSNNFLETRA